MGDNKPFEWLSGGLFFGIGKSGGGIDSVESCKDASLLLNGINDNLDAALAEETAAAAAAATAAVGDQQQSSSTTTTTSNKPDSNTNTVESSSSPSQSKFLASRLARLRFLLYDERRVTSQQENARRINPVVATATVQALAGDKLQHLIPKLLTNLQGLPFESRKHVAAIFNYLLVCGLEGSDRDAYKAAMNSFRDYIDVNFDPIIQPIIKGHYCNNTSGGGGSSSGGSGYTVDVGLHCGSMFRSCLKHVSLYRHIVISTESVQKFVLPFLDDLVNLPNFDISSDAMESLKIIFTAGNEPHLNEIEQKEMADLAATFLTRDYDMIWDQRFNPKLMTDEANYMTKRVALQILSTVLLTRSNYAVMIKYVNSRKNLILVMHLLRDTSPHITLDAFHVFKVFVANPNKIPEVVKILHDNSTKLCAYLETLHRDKEASDNQFRDEKALIIQTIQNL